MKTKPWAMGLVLLITFMTSIAQLLWKLGADNFRPDFLALATNWYLIGGIILYGAGAALLILALRGGELTVLYPLVATSYIWVTLLSMFYLGESIPPLRWAGVFLIVAGISFVGGGGE